MSGPICARLWCDKPAAPRQKYCSLSCAPYADLAGKSTSSESKTERSSPMRGGETSVRSSPTVFQDSPVKRESVTGMTESGPIAGTSFTQRSEPTLGDSDRSEPKKTESMSESETETGISETRSSLESENTSVVEGEDLTLSDLSISSERAKSTSLSLIDESAQQLRQLMKSVGERKDLKAPEINAVCGLAKQIHNLIRLKLDIVKEATK